MEKRTEREGSCNTEEAHTENRIVRLKASLSQRRFDKLRDVLMIG